MAADCAERSASCIFSVKRLVSMSDLDERNLVRVSSAQAIAWCATYCDDLRPRMPPRPGPGPPKKGYRCRKKNPRPPVIIHTMLLPASDLFESGHRLVRHECVVGRKFPREPH